MKQAMLACLLGGTLAVTSGCCGLFRSILCSPLDCIEPSCGEAGCSSGCGSSGCGHCAPARVATCESCESSCGDSGGCKARSGGRCGPLAWLFGVFESDCYPDCGCGEAYGGECKSDLPDCHDPCDCQGNWVGRGCGGCAKGRCRGGCNGGAADCASGGCVNGNGGCANCAKAKPVGTTPVYARTIPQAPSAPRIISQTEGVIAPTLGPEPTWQAAQPRRATVQR